MSLFASFIIALFVTMVLVPPLMRVSGALKLVDVPTPRKAHPGPIPCSGGIAMTVGVLVPSLIWAPLDRPFLHLFIAALIVVLLGIWDDRTGIDYKWKFLGQLVAALVVIQGGIVIEHLPFFGLDRLPAYIIYTRDRHIPGGYHKRNQHVRRAGWSGCRVCASDPWHARHPLPTGARPKLCSSSHLVRYG